MLSKEEFQKIVDTLKSKLDDTTGALVSEELLALLSSYNNGFDDAETLKSDIETLKAEKEDLLKVNGKLYQQIGFVKEEPEKIEEDDDEEKIEIEDIIDEKGELI